MNIDVFIKRAKEKAEEYKYRASFFDSSNPMNAVCIKVAKDHEQLAEWLEKSKEYQQLEEQGRLIKLPCKAGDTVYEIAGATTHGYGYGWKCLTYEKAYVHETVFNLGRLNDIGKTVFLTREEAEAKLKELRGEQNGKI